MANLINIILEPGKVFEHIKEKDDWWIPFIVVVVFSLLVTWISAPAITRLTAEKMAEMGITRELPKGIGVIRYISIPVFTILGWLAMSLILWLFGSSFDGKWNYIKSLDLFAYSSVVIVIKQILNIIFLLIRGIPNITSFKDIGVATGLDLFIKTENPKLYALVSGIDIFQIWIFTLIAFGVAEITGISRKKGALVSILTFLVTLGFKILFARKGAM